MTIKLHLFTGFENQKLHITSDMELGHLYSTTNRGELIGAAKSLGLSANYIQEGDLVHFDIWGKPLIAAKKMFHVVSDLELATDMRVMNLRK